MPRLNQKCKKWCKEDEEFIFDNYKTISVKEMAFKFDVTNKTMRTKIERMGIKLKPLGRILAVIWNDDDLNFLKNNWLMLEDEEIAKELGYNRGFSKMVVFRKRKSLNLIGKSKRIRSEKTGYKYHIEYDKKIYTHRRKIKSYEIVHHLDGDKTNDSDDNLYLCKDKSEHSLLHDQLEKISCELVKKGIIRFDRNERKYYLQLPTRTEG